MDLVFMLFRYQESKTLIEDVELPWENIIPTDQNSREVTPDGLLLWDGSSWIDGGKILGSPCFQLLV
jgi:hypothetical protein